MEKSIIALFLTAGQLFAQTEAPKGVLAQPPAAQPSVDAVAEAKRQLSLGASSCVGRTGPFVAFEYLYWKSQFSDSLITTKYANDVADGDIVTEGKRERMQFRYNSGFALGLGINLPDRGWSPFICWTYLHSHPHKAWHSDRGAYTNTLAQVVTDNVIAPPTLGHLFTNDVSADWMMNLNVLDLEIGKNFQLARNLFQRAFGCIRTVSIASKLRVKYSNQFGFQDLFEVYPTVQWPDQIVHMKNQCWMIGPRVGFNYSFGLFGDFSLWANVATSLLAAFDDPNYTADVVIPAGEHGPIPEQAQLHLREVPAGVRFKSPQVQFRPGFDCFLGISWGHCFPKKAFIDVIVGYSAEYYGQTINPLQSLSVFGWTGTFGVSF